MKLIDKDAVVAEIERLIKLFTIPQYQCEYNDAKADGFREFLSFIDTLEVKEVDLDKELNDFIEQQKAWIKDDWVVEYNNGDSFNHIYDLRELAKHFFELGIKALKAL